MEKSMPKIERQLRLYELVCGYTITSFEAIREVFPDSSRRMIQRDLKDLKDAGLVSVKYVRKAQGYVKEKQTPGFNEKTGTCRKAHLKRLHRIGRLMSELYNEDIPLYEKKDNEAEGEVREYVTSKDSYNKLFPGLSERTRQRDFEVLCRLGYQVFYDHRDHCFSQEEFSMNWAEAPEVIDKDYLEGNY